MCLFFALRLLALGFVGAESSALVYNRCNASHCLPRFTDGQRQAINDGPMRRKWGPRKEPNLRHSILFVFCFLLFLFPSCRVNFCCRTPPRGCDPPFFPRTKLSHKKQTNKRESGTQECPTRVFKEKTNKTKTSKPYSEMKTFQRKFVRKENFMLPRCAWTKCLK